MPPFDINDPNGALGKVIVASLFPDSFPNDKYADNTFSLRLTVVNIDPSQVEVFAVWMKVFM